jgi:hypothetical protein
MLLGMKSRRVLAVAVVMASLLSLAVGGRSAPSRRPLETAQASASLPSPTRTPGTPGVP